MTDAPTATSRRTRRRILVLAGLLVLIAVTASVLVWFQPQKLFIDDEVDEALPGLVVAGAPAEAATPDGTTPPPALDTVTPATVTPATATPETVTPATVTPETTPPALPANSLARAATEAASLGAPVAAGTGKLVSLDHATSGEALVVVRPDGSRLLRLEALDTENGPDLRVVLSPARAGGRGYEGLVELGRLKGNKGSQNYEIPAGLDLTTIGSVVIWCERFSSPFGEAPVEVVA